MAATILTEKDVRIFLMDKPELNPLLQGVRWSAEDIDKAMMMTVDFFNTIMPPTGNSYTVENFPFAHIMMLGTTGYLLKSAAVNQASNNITYMLDGVQVNDNDKADIFMKLGNDYWTEFKELATNTKLNQNVALYFGHYGSENILIAR